MCLNLKTEFTNIQMLMSLSIKRVLKEVLTAHILWERVGGEPIDSPTVNVSHSPTIDVEYVFVSSNTVTILRLLQ